MFWKPSASCRPREESEELPVFWKPSASCRLRAEFEELPVFWKPSASRRPRAESEELPVFWKPSASLVMLTSGFYPGHSPKYTEFLSLSVTLAKFRVNLVSAPIFYNPRVNLFLFRRLPSVYRRKRVFYLLHKLDPVYFFCILFYLSFTLTQQFPHRELSASPIYTTLFISC